jgi:hypothetical protein
MSLFDDFPPKKLTYKIPTINFGIKSKLALSPPEALQAVSFPWGLGKIFFHEQREFSHLM